MSFGRIERVLLKSRLVAVAWSMSAVAHFADSSRTPPESEKCHERTSPVIGDLYWKWVRPKQRPASSALRSLHPKSGKRRTLHLRSRRSGSAWMHFTFVLTRS